VIEIRDLSKTYTTSGVEHAALEHVDLTIEDGDIFGIIGVSGAGKSTLVRCINLLERPTSGSILIDGETIPLTPGRYVLVQPPARRRVDAGPEGLSYLVIGALVQGEAG